MIGRRSEPVQPWQLPGHPCRFAGASFGSYGCPGNRARQPRLCRGSSCPGIALAPARHCPGIEPSPRQPLLRSSGPRGAQHPLPGVTREVQPLPGRSTPPFQRDVARPSVLVRKCRNGVRGEHQSKDLRRDRFHPCRGSGALMQPKQAVSPEVRIEITPTVAEYEQLCRDLEKLRERGAISNTAAILQAVRGAASKGKIRHRSANGKGARTRPHPHQEGDS